MMTARFGIRFKSSRPLIRDPLQLVLPPIQADGLNQLPWPLLAETAFDRPFRVTFHEHLRKLDGKRVVLTGFMQPTGDGLEQFAVLLLEYPVGCWYCELPEPTGLILVLAPEGKAIASLNALKSGIDAYSRLIRGVHSRRSEVFNLAVH